MTVSSLPAPEHRGIFALYKLVQNVLVYSRHTFDGSVLKQYNYLTLPRHAMYACKHTRLCFTYTHIHTYKYTLLTFQVDILLVKILK